MPTTPTLLYQATFLRLVRINNWEFVERTHPRPPVGIVAVTDPTPDAPQGKILLVEQFRVPLGTSVIEIPAGLVGDIAGHESEAFADAAKRELLEETGYSPQHITSLTQGPTSAGLTNELIHLVRATGLTKVGPGTGDGTENITVHEIPLHSAPAWLAEKHRTGTPVDPKVYAALWFATHP